MKNNEWDLIRSATRKTSIFIITVLVVVALGVLGWKIITFIGWAWLLIAGVLAWFYYKEDFSRRLPILWSDIPYWIISTDWLDEEAKSQLELKDRRKEERL